jgi:hypothetical protein
MLVVVERLGRYTEPCISDCAWETGFPDGVIVFPIVLSRDALRNGPLREPAFFKNVYREGVAV